MSCPSTAVSEQSNTVWCTGVKCAATLPCNVKSVLVRDMILTLIEAHELAGIAAVCSVCRDPDDVVHTARAVVHLHPSSVASSHDGCSVFEPRCSVAVGSCPG